MVEDDCRAWAEMRFELWAQLSVDDHLDEVRRIVGSRKRAGYLAFGAKGDPLGFAEASVRDYANGCTSQPGPFLEGIWVRPRYRRKGIGRALIETLTGDFIKAGFSEICSDAHIRNRGSHRAHGAWGFSETDRVVCFRKALS